MKYKQMLKLVQDSIIIERKGIKAKILIILSDVIEIS